MLKGGHEAPTKPKGRPKKNSIPTTEEIEAEERRMQLEEEERARREAEGAALDDDEELEGHELGSETRTPAEEMEEPERELPLLMQSETHAVSSERTTHAKD